MRVLFAFAVGYAIGARGGSEGFDEVVRSFKAIADSEEVKGFAMAVRSHASYTLHELAARIESGDVTLDGESLIDRVRHITGHE